ncbi:MAG: HAD-IB family phosphatase [Gammaproteobacteria bacterium]|nr:HAD-IB family phosphatase [Gammaproteobacteria bacterium]
MALAVFDIDGTLVAGPGTEKRFFLELLRRGRIGPRQLLACLAFLLRWTPRYGWHVFKKNKAYLAGLREADVERLAAAWAGGQLARAWFEPCRARLRRHQEAGDTVVLLSGTPQFVAEAIGRALGVTDVVGSRCVVEAGRFRAAPPLRHPFRAEKLALVLERLRAHEATFAYGDSIYDLPLLEAAGTAVAVRPDEALAAHAAQAGWEIIGPVRRGFFSVARAAVRLTPASPRADER